MSKLHRRKRKDHKPCSYVERIPGNLTRADITDRPSALNEVGVILTIPAKLIPRDTHHVAVQPNSLNEVGVNILYVMYQRLISQKKDCHKSYHPQSESHTAGRAQVGRKTNYK
jgi:hypothetical protein